MNIFPIGKDKVRKNYNVFHFYRLRVIYSARDYSVFPKSMRNPVFKEEEQLELEEDKQLQKLSLQRILPAFSNHTSSEFHDPLTRYVTLDLSLTFLKN